MPEFLRVIAFRLRALFFMDRVDAEFQAELSTHLDLLTDEYIRSGHSPEEARRLAHLRLGGATQLRESHRDGQGIPFLETVVQDLRYTVRMLRAKPVFTAVAVITLALGIGANTAIFSVVNAAFLRPLPYPESDRLYVVRRVGNRFGGASLSMPMYIAWQKQQGLFEHLALFRWTGPATLTSSGEAERINTAGATTDFFAALGVHPLLGRDFRPEEGQVGGSNVVLLSERMWRNRFHSDPNILGTNVVVNEQPFTVIGVLPRNFDFPIAAAREADVWFPVRVPATSNNPSNGGLLCIALLKPGIAPAQAESALTQPLRELRNEFPTMFSEQERAWLQPLRTFVSSRAGSAPLLMLGAVVLVLLIACVNIANLMLASATARQREIAMRAALGANRGRIIRQLLTESVLLALMGGAVGVLACRLLFASILTLVPADIPHVGVIRIDVTVFAFALLLTVVVGLLFGLLPAIGASRYDLNLVLKKAQRTSSMSQGRLRGLLAANEIALSLVLLVGAALALQSLARLMNVRPGFETDHIVTFRIDLPAKKYDSPARRKAFFDGALSRLAALPGVETSAIISNLPFLGGPDTLFSIEGGRQLDRGAANFRLVTPQLFSALAIPLKRGRVLNDADNAGAKPVVVVNQAFARRYLAGNDVIGTQLWICKPMGPENTEPAPREIVGVVADIHESSLADPPEPTMYIPYAQNSTATGGFFTLRTTRDPLASVADIRAAMHTLDPGLPVSDVRTLQQVVEDSTQDWRARAVLLGGFGALALIIAAIGVYGVISYSVAQRTQEMGVRIALGANRRQLLTLILGQGMRTALTGIVIGLVAAFALTRLMRNLLYSVSATDPLTFIAVTALLALVSLLACYVPARRAMQVDSLTALRSE